MKRRRSFGDSTEDGPTTDGYDLAQANSTWGFELDTRPVEHVAQQVVTPNGGPEKAGKKIKDAVTGN